MRKFVLGIALGLAAGAATVSAAQAPGQDPFVFVSSANEDGTPVTAATLTWYLLPMTIRPTGTSISGVSIAAINTFLDQQSDRPTIMPDKWCFANALSERSYVSANRVVQANIEQSFRNNPDHHFQLRGRFTGGDKLLAVVGHYEDCSNKAHSFIMLLGAGSATPRIMHVETLPYVSGLQYMRLVDGNITVSTCFECGDVSGLFYDTRRRRWYWEMLGD